MGPLYILLTDGPSPFIAKRQTNGTYVKVGQVWDAKEADELCRFANEGVRALAG